MNMGTSIYKLPDKNGDETKIWYSLGMGMRMNFFFGMDIG